jgi:AcrR family transcriptional regulator
MRLSCDSSDRFMPAPSPRNSSSRRKRAGPARAPSRPGSPIAAKRRVATAARQRAILDAALACFSQLGYEQTTMAHVRDRAGASTGSIYHHFKSKEQLARALYLEGIREAQASGLAALVKQRSTERGIMALVNSYLDWVDAHRDWARFLLSARHAEFMVAAEDELSAMNRASERAAAAWLEERTAAGELPRLDPALFRALIYAPVGHFARSFLAGNTTVSMAEAKLTLARASWHALRGLLPR